MQLDKLQLDLRPRTNEQALDLGFALLRANAAGTYLAWNALWLPWVTMCGVVVWFKPEYLAEGLVLAVWIRPFLERAPLYLLSRQVFGENVGWADAVRAWPRQLGGGWFGMITWRRLFSVTRCLYQPIWQLEGARGEVARERKSVIGRNGTGRSAGWFGVACGIFEGILQLGLITCIGIFVSDENAVNPFLFLIQLSEKTHSPEMIVGAFSALAFSGSIVGPIYTACGFTLYLNRRATLEAWDLEIALRQIKPPARILPGAAATLALLFSIAAFAVAWAPGSALAAEDHSAGSQCAKSVYARNQTATEAPDQNPAQAAFRKEVAHLYDSDDLRGYSCEQVWRLKEVTIATGPEQPEARSLHVAAPDLSGIASLIEILMIAGLIILVMWLAYRYRDQFAAMLRSSPGQRATEIAGLDIRPESLPVDVAGRVGELWKRGQRRAALALLYRATISRLVNDDRLPLHRAATEGDCVRLADQAYQGQKLGAGRMRAIISVTDIWVRAAYGDRWPDDATVSASCAAWRAEFGTSRSGKSAKQ